MLHFGVKIPEIHLTKWESFYLKQTYSSGVEKSGHGYIYTKKETVVSIKILDVEYVLIQDNIYSFPSICVERQVKLELPDRYTELYLRKCSVSLKNHFNWALIFGIYGSQEKSYYEVCRHQM